MSAFCASCAEEAADLVSVMLDERRALLCGACNDEHPRSGRWAFEGGADRAPRCSLQGSKRRGRSIAGQVATAPGAK